MSQRPLPPSAGFPRCACGQDRDGPFVTEEPFYGWRDYLWMLVGVSSRPVPYLRRCAICGHVFEKTEPKRPW